MARVGRSFLDNDNDNDTLRKDENYHLSLKLLLKVCGEQWGECEDRMQCCSPSITSTREGGEIHKTLNMKVDHQTTTRDKGKKWGWHHRGYVWDDRASQWAGAEDWREKGKCWSTVDKSMSHHTKNGKRRQMVRLTLQSQYAVKVLLCNSVDTAKWLNNGSTATTRWERCTKEKLAESRKRCTLDGRGVLHTPWDVQQAHLQRTQSRSEQFGESGNGRKIEDHDRRRQAYRGEESIRGYGRKKRCAIVIKAVDWEKRITNSRTAVPLKACTAMAAGITEDTVLTEVLDLLFDKKAQMGRRQRVHQSNFTRKTEPETLEIIEMKNEKIER